MTHILGTVNHFAQMNFTAVCSLHLSVIAVEAAAQSPRIVANSSIRTVDVAPGVWTWSTLAKHLVNEMPHSLPQTVQCQRSVGRWSIVVLALLIEKHRPTIGGTLLGVGMRLEEKDAP